MSQMAWRAAIALTVAVMLQTSPARARPAHRRALADYFGPFLAQKLNDCRTCHVPETPGEPQDHLVEVKPHNAFGARVKALKKQLQKAGKKTDIPSRIEAIANEDSDGDGVSNLIELLTGHYPGEPNDKPTAAELAKSPQLLEAFRKFQQEYRWKPFDTVQRPAVPKVKNETWVRNAVRQSAVLLCRRRS